MIRFVFCICIAACCMSFLPAFAGYEFEVDPPSPEEARIQRIYNFVEKVTWKGAYASHPRALAEQIFKLETNRQSNYSPSEIRNRTANEIRHRGRSGRPCNGFLNADWEY